MVCWPIPYPHPIRQSDGASACRLCYSAHPAVFALQWCRCVFPIHSKLNVLTQPAVELTTEPIKVMVVALPLTAWGISRMLELPEAEGLNCVAVAPTIALAVNLLPTCKPDLALVDLDGEEGPDSLAILATPGRTKILAMTSSTSTALLDQAILAGARGLLNKQEQVATLLKAMRKVHEGEMWMDRSATSRIFLELARRKAQRVPDPEASRLNALTRRERQTIKALMDSPAAPAKVLAKELTISEHTLRNHLTSIYAKLDVANRTELYAFIQRQRLKGNAD